jgi:hypothetical protein
VKHSDDRIELVGQRYGRPRHRRLAKLVARRRRIGADRVGQIVIIDGLPHPLRVPLFARVDASHHTLQLGELGHHLGRHIRFHEPPGGCRCIGDGP